MMQRSSIFLKRNTTKALRAFTTTKDPYSSLEGKIFGDERDSIARRLIRDGGAPELIIENLKTVRKKFSHDPIRYSADVPQPPEDPYISLPNERPEKKVSIKYILYSSDIF